MKIVEFNNEIENREELIDKFLELHNQEQNLKMLSFTGIPFGGEFFRELVNSTENVMGIKQFHIFNVENEFCGFIVTKESIMYGFELLSIAIVNNKRNKGYATALINFACNYAKTKNYKQLFANVFADNKKILKLLIDLDFIPVNIQHHSRYDGADLIVLQKQLF